MIEVEKNFDLAPGDKEGLIRGARFLERRVLTDVYYDTSEYDLTCRDYWLRERNGRWELKVPLNSENIGERLTDQYRELENEEEIVRQLDLRPGLSFVVALKEKRIEPFVTMVTTRESFEKDGFHFDFDEMDFGFVTFEAELMVKDVKEISLAEKRLMGLAEIYGIKSTKGRGKVIEYLARYSPRHYEALVRAGVVKE